jgi:hypothetical protein
MNAQGPRICLKNNWSIRLRVAFLSKIKTLLLEYGLPLIQRIRWFNFELRIKFENNKISSIGRHWHPKILWFWVWYLGFPPKPKPKPKNPKNPKFKPKPKPKKTKNLGPKTQKLKIF